MSTAENSHAKLWSSTGIWGRIYFTQKHGHTHSISECRPSPGHLCDKGSGHEEQGVYWSGSAPGAPLQFCHYKSLQVTSDLLPPSDETSLVLLHSFRTQIKGGGASKWPIPQTCPKHTDAQLQGSPVAMQMRENAKKWILITPETSNYRAATQNLSPRDAFQKWRRGLRTLRSPARAIFTRPSWQQT